MQIQKNGHPSFFRQRLGLRGDRIVCKGFGQELERENEMNSKSLSPTGIIPAPPLPVPLKTSLFFGYKGQVRDSWSFFARNVGQSYRSLCGNAIVAGGGTSIIALMSNGDPRAPVSFFEDEWGGTADMQQLTLLEDTAKLVSKAGGALWPCFLCDGNESAHIRNAPMAVHDRALSLLIAHTRPYVPGYCIGLESSENLDCARHNEFVRMIKKYAPDRYVLSHMQRIPDGGMPDIDAWMYEHSWDPNKGDEHSPEEVVAEARAAQKHGKYVWPVEYNVNINGSRIREQSRALIAAGFGCGGPL